MKKFISLLLMLYAFAGTAIAETRQMVEIPVGEGRTLSGIIFLPDRTDPAPAVIVLHTAYGSVEDFDEDYARALAKEGFVSLAVNYIHPSFGRAVWSPGIISDLVVVVDYLRQRPEAKNMPVGTVGFSLGSRGLQLSARHPQVKAVVVYYGTYDVRKENPRRAGRLPPGVTLPISVAPQVNAAVLLLHGEADNEVPVSSARDMKAELDKTGKKSELVVYPGAYHRFDRGAPTGARSDVSRDGYIYQKNPEATKDAFQRTLAWFRTYLVGAPAPNEQLDKGSSSSRTEKVGAEPVGPTGRTPSQVISGSDRDGDGKLSKSEFRGSPTAFTKIDTNEDGFIDKQELIKAWQ